MDVTHAEPQRPLVRHLALVSQRLEPLLHPRIRAQIHMPVASGIIGPREDDSDRVEPVEVGDQRLFELARDVFGRLKAQHPVRSRLAHGLRQVGAPHQAAGELGHIRCTIEGAHLDAGYVSSGRWRATKRVGVAAFASAQLDHGTARKEARQHYDDTAVQKVGVRRRKFPRTG